MGDLDVDGVLISKCMVRACALDRRSQGGGGGGEHWRIPVNTAVDLVTCNKHFLVDVFKDVLLLTFDMLFSSLL